MEISLTLSLAQISSWIIKENGEFSARWFRHKKGERSYRNNFKRFKEDRYRYFFGGEMYSREELEKEFSDEGIKCPDRINAEGDVIVRPQISIRMANGDEFALYKDSIDDIRNDIEKKILDGKGYTITFTK